MKKQGFLVQRGLFSPAQLQGAQRAVQLLVAELNEKLLVAGRVKRRHRSLQSLEEEYPGAAVLIHTQGRLPREVAELWSSPQLMSKAAELMDCAQEQLCAHPAWNIRSKVPRNALFDVPSHQDSAYLEEGAGRQLTAWVPLVNARRENGALQVVPRKENKLHPHVVDGGVDGGWYLRLQDEPSDDAFETLEVDIGDVVFMDELTIHRSTPNISQETRWSLDLRFCRDNEPSGTDKKPLPLHNINWDNAQHWMEERRVSERDEFDTAVRLHDNEFPHRA